MDQSLIKKPLPKCIHVFTDTVGPCVSRNMGAKRAKGEVLVFLDDDARIYDDFIEEITGSILNGKFDAVAGAICDMEGKYLLSGTDNFEKKSSNFIKVFTSNPNSDRSRITFSFPAGCSAIRTEVFQKMGGFDESFDPTGAGEDREMAIKLFKNGYAIWYNSNAKLLHIGATDGGSRDLGSRSLMLDVNTYKICQKHFSAELANALKSTIIFKYRKEFLNSIRTGKLVRTKFKLYRKIKDLLNS
jgi:GT2 family glycosyltransferase